VPSPVNESLESVPSSETLTEPTDITSILLVPVGGAVVNVIPVPLTL